MFKKKFDLKINSKIYSFKKVIYPDGDKSISIRGFLTGAISQNTSIISNVLESEDVHSTINCLKMLGVTIKKVKKKKYFINGKGLGSLHLKKNGRLNFGNSGTLARLLIGILSTTPGINAILEGDHSLNKRSMKKVISLMEKFGAYFVPKNKTNFPLRLISSEMPIGIDYNANFSAQLKSAVIFAGLNSYGKTKINELQNSRDHTERMLLDNHKVIKVKKNPKKIIEIYGKKSLKKININVPNDPSAGAFYSALTLLNQNSLIKLKNVGLNSTRTGFYKLLKKHGANIKFENLKNKNNELRGDVIVKSCKLKPIHASKNYYTIMTDEYPILFVMAALIKGISTFKGIGDLVNKESNRIKEMQKILSQINIKTIASNNELKIYGQGIINLSNKNITVPNLGDHRICMATFILAILTGAKTKIKNFETVFTSSPSFLKILKTLGAKFEIQK